MYLGQISGAGFRTHANSSAAWAALNAQCAPVLPALSTGDESVDKAVDNRVDKAGDIQQLLDPPDPSGRGRRA